MPEFALVSTAVPRSSLRPQPLGVRSLMPGTYTREEQSKFSWRIVPYAVLDMSPIEARARWNVVFDRRIHEVGTVVGSTLLVDTGDRPVWVEIGLSELHPEKVCFFSPTETPKGDGLGIRGRDVIANFGKVLVALGLTREQVTMLDLSDLETARPVR